MGPQTTSPATQPRFSIISAVHNVARYLDAYIASIEAQKFSLDRVEIIAVDDGSTDESLSLLRAWQERRPDLVRIFTKANGGQASARNLGLEHARGEWVTFADPDDMLELDYLVEVDRFLIVNPTTELVGCSRTLYHDVEGTYAEHPLRLHFAAGNQLVDLDDHSWYFYASAPCAFFRREVIEQSGLRFDEEIRPNFEDAHFTTRYLLDRPRRLVGFVDTARYLYRKRGDGSSTLNNSLMDARKFTVVPERGYLDVLRRGAERTGTAPAWVQNLVLYDLSWIFIAEDKPAQSQSAAQGDVAAQFNRHLATIAELLDEQVVREFAVPQLSPEWRERLLHGYTSQSWRPPIAYADRRDRHQKLVRVRYRFVGELPTEVFTVSGRVVAPLHAKVRGLPAFEHTALHERLAWLPKGEIQLQLDGNDVEIVSRERRTVPRPDGAATSAPAAPRGLRARLPQGGVGEAALVRLARTRPVRKLFGQAWVLMDRIHDADDSGEHLFRYLRKHHPGTNAWFVIEKGTADYTRLREKGYRRVVPHGSLRWKLLMLNCRHLISSHADAAVCRPPALSSLIPRPKWRFTFLNHGVIKDDLSGWLNPKQMDLFVTSTTGEYLSVCGDGTTYTYTTKEAILTGLPRFDALFQEGKKCPAEKRDLILIAPTWRHWLLPDPKVGTQQRDWDSVNLLDSEFVQQWHALLSSERIHEVATQMGLTVATLLHPNLQEVGDQLGLPDSVHMFPFEGVDVRKLFARSRILVTDYSSMAFNAAYIDRPVVYFQFDRDRVLGGGHVGRAGYFDYERDGFGPVALDLDTAVDSITKTVMEGPHPAPMFSERIAATFPQRDGKCCRRVVAEIRASHRPAPSAGC